MDWNPTANQTVAMRYFYTENPQTTTLGGGLPGRTINVLFANTYSQLRWTSILTPGLLNQARVSFQRIIQDGRDSVPFTAEEVGIKPMVPQPDGRTQPPLFLILGAFQIGGAFYPSFSPTNQIQFADQISWTRGRHSVRTGIEYEAIQWNLVFGGLGRGFFGLGSFNDLLIGREGCHPHLRPREYGRHQQQPVQQLAVLPVLPVLRPQRSWRHDS